MSGPIVTGPFGTPPDCPKGLKPQWNPEERRWECVPDFHNQPFALIWQGDCDGWLAIRLSYMPVVNPHDRRQGPTMSVQRALKSSNPEIALADLSRRLSGLKKLKTRLQTALRGAVKAQKGQARSRATQRTRAKAKAKARTKAVRKKK
jgi:hypothetical protein